MRGSRGLRLVLVLMLCGLVAFACAVANVSHISLLPPSIKPRQLQVAAASTRVAVDLPKPIARDSEAALSQYDDLQRRAVLIANLMTSDAAIDSVARRSHIPRDLIAARTTVVYQAQKVMFEPDSERRAEQIADTRRPYALEIRPDPKYPKITIYAQAPTVIEAQRMADAVLPAVRQYLDATIRRQGGDPSRQVRLEQLGDARGAVLNGGVRLEIAGLTFLFVFGMTALLPLGLAYARRRRGAQEASAEPLAHAAGGSWRSDHGNGNGNGDRNGNGNGNGNGASHHAAPIVAHSNGKGTVRRLPPASGVATTVAAAEHSTVLTLPSSPVITHPRPTGHEPGSIVRAVKADAWPRTPRLLPWLIAFFLVIIWLVPFNEIQLAISLPIDLKFDRLFLPPIAAVWILIVVAGGPGAPKLRITPIHLVLGAVLMVACLSLVLNAHELTRTLEFDTGAKKLTLLGAYVATFVIVASVVRRSEVEAFLTFTLILASICALGTIVEYRFHFNVFFWACDKLLPGIFTINSVTSTAVDEIGRPLMRGPAELPLETVAMLALALPIALARLIHPKPGQRRWVYGLVIALLMAAMVSTFRKTGLLAPVSVCLTFAYFRRRELIKLAPLGLVVIVFVHVLSPGALTGVVGQLDRSRLGVTTVSDRTADYDAVRPDVWSHLAFGRGYGSYEHTAYRILDMELLGEVIEVGIVGLLLYLGMAIVVVALARAPIRARGPDAPVALAAAAAAVAFVVVSALFDVMSFPHTPYIFLFMAALLAVIRGADGERKARIWKP
jgi:hypothetical protein